MAISTSSPSTCPTALPLPIPNTNSNHFSCGLPASSLATAASLRFASCCWNDRVKYLSHDHCFQWCHIRDDWHEHTPSWPGLGGSYDVGNATAGGNQTERLRLSLKACLENVTYPTLPPPRALLDSTDNLVCQQNSPANVPADYDFWARPGPTDCDLVHPSYTLNLLGKNPECSTRMRFREDGEEDTNTTFAHCCSWAPRRARESKCYESCQLPKGNAPYGEGSLTNEEAVGSFKMCMLRNGGGEKALDGVYCTWGDMFDLKAYNVTTTAYLDASGKTAMPSLTGILVLSMVVVAFLGV